MLDELSLKKCESERQDNKESHFKTLKIKVPKPIKQSPMSLSVISKFSDQSPLKHHNQMNEDFLSFSMDSSESMISRNSFPARNSQISEESIQEIENLRQNNDFNPFQADSEFALTSSFEDSQLEVLKEMERQFQSLGI